MWVYGGIVFWMVAVGVLAADKSVTVGDITAKVRGQSGKILIYKGMNESDGITVTFDAIREISTDDEEIQENSYNNFAQLSFEFSELVNSTYAGSNVSVTEFNFTSSIPLTGGSATLTSYVYIFTSDGNITVDGNDEYVMAGNMKFNVKIESWPFCDTCTKGNKVYTGKYVDFYVEIKGKGALSSSNSGSGTYVDADGSKVLTPKQVLYDNNTTENMPDDYPKLETKGSKQTFIFRFRKFDNSALYDPILAVSADTDGGDGGSGDNTESEIDASGVSAKVLGSSGKITLEQTSGDKKRFTVEFDNLKEMKDEENAVKDSSHSINTFANQEFKFQAPVDENYPGTSIGVKRLTFNASLNNGASLTVHIYIFKAAGNITQENETVSVKEGYSKFNIEISGWTFCAGTSCQQNEVGKYLDFDIVIKGKSGSAKKDNSASESYTLGDSGSVMLSKKIMVDGASDLVDMEASYPKLLAQGSKQIFRFRFPKFSSSIKYDPTLSFSSDDGTNSAVKQTMSIFVLAMMAFLYYLF